MYNLFNGMESDQITNSGGHLSHLGKISRENMGVPVWILVILSLGCSTFFGVKTFGKKTQTQNGEVSVKPEKQNKILENHGKKRVDPYFWMNQRDSKPVLEFIESENQKVKSSLQSTEKLQADLFTEMKNRIKDEDESVPVKDGAYLYQFKTVSGKEYPQYLRASISDPQKKIVILDENLESKDSAFYSSTGPIISPNAEIMAFGEDRVGRRFYDLRFRNLMTGKELPDKIEKTSGQVAWSLDNKTIFYVQQDPETLRANRLFRYVLGSGKSELIYEEKDETFFLNLDSSKNNKYLILQSFATVSSEARVLDAKTPMTNWKLIQAREDHHEYSIDWAGGDQFYVVTNWKAKNFRVMSFDLKNPSRDHWQEVLPHRDDVYVQGIDIYKDFYTVSERFNGLTRIRWVNRQSQTQDLVAFPDETYITQPSGLPEYESSVFRYTYETLHRPPSLYEFDFKALKSQLLKQKEAPSYNSELYETKRFWARAKDGSQIPISYVARKDRPQKPGPVLLYGYGSYGMSMEPNFANKMVSLLDRGFGFAIAHIRGGSEMGREWYESGKLMKKMNTFTDFIACAEHLIQNHITSPQQLHIMGGSAGGLLMGAVTNLRPDLFKTVTAQVPFVDVVTTMLDETIPLTTFEYDEWGNPNQKDAFEYMLTYSPYDNVAAKDYPHIFALTGYHDSQVQYWEPAKWVAKLGDMKTDQNELLFFTEMSAGHGGASGRFQSLHQYSMIFAFIIKHQK